MMPGYPSGIGFTVIAASFVRVASNLARIPAIFCRVRRIATAKRPRATSVASDGDALLAAAVPARRDLGRLVPLHQGRARGPRAGADDGDPARSSPGSCSSGTSSRLWVPGARSPSCARAGAPALVLGTLNAADPLLADRLGREAHRLERRGDRAVDGADLHLPARDAVPAARARRRRDASRASLSASAASSSSPASTRAAAGWRWPGRSRSSSRHSRTRRPGSTVSSACRRSPARCSRRARCSPEGCCSCRSRSSNSPTTSPTPSPSRRSRR